MLRHGTIAGLALMLTLTVGAQQQANSTQQSQSGQSQSSQSTGSQPKKSGSGQKTSSPQSKQDAAKTGAQAGSPSGSTVPQNPFPTAQSEKAARQDQQQQQREQQDSAPSAPAPMKKNAASDQNPFPEAESEKAQKEQQQQEQQQAAQKPGQDYSGSSVKGLGLPAAGEPAVPPASLQEDLRVGKFYLQTGDYRGALSRFQSAEQLNPDSAEAVWGLAESERHLGMTKQAVANYQLYLAALPDGPRAKDAKKALKELGAKP